MEKEQYAQQRIRRIQVVARVKGLRRGVRRDAEQHRDLEIEQVPETPFAQHDAEPLDDRDGIWRWRRESGVACRAETNQAADQHDAGKHGSHPSMGGARFAERAQQKRAACARDHLGQCSAVNAECD